MKTKRGYARSSVEPVVIADLGHNLHCGACMTDFENTTALDKHLETCPAAKAMLFPLHKLLFVGENQVGHPLGRLIHLCHKNSHLIRRYAYAVADDLNSLSRAEIHHDLCDRLDIDYKTFRPFESERITEMPSRQQAEAILWEAIGDELRKL